MVEGSEKKFAPPELEQRFGPEARSEFGFAGTKQKKELESQINKLQEQLNELSTEEGGLDAEKSAERQEMEFELEEKQLELKVFLQEHDNAGAFKMKRFNEGFGQLFDEGKLSIKEDGTLELADSEQNRRMAVVNVGELARFNKEGGGHKAGDAILSEAVYSIEDQVIKKLKAIGQEDADYTILRYSGNEYMVDIQDISKQDMQRLVADISRQQPSIEGVKDAAPLAGAQTGFAEMVSAYNESWKRFAEQEGGTEGLPIPDEKTIRRDSYGIMKDIANYELDVEKFSSRTSRVQDKIDELGLDGARPFFDNYMKKMFAESPLQNLEDFVGKSDLEVYDLAFDWASEMLGQAEEMNEMLDEIAEAFARRVLERQRSVELPEKFVYASGEEVSLADVPAQTRGQQELSQAQQVEDEAQKEYEADDTVENKHKYNMAKLDNRLVKARRDQGTGLLERGVYYGEMQESLAQDKEMSVVFVDMGFLKYFDQAGGREVGDSALKLAADMMEQAVEEAGLEATVYRYGGDEFTVRIDGGQDKVDQFNAQLRKLTKEAGAVPSGQVGHDRGYYPTRLEFNYGAADTELLEEALDMLEEAGHLDKDQRADPKMRTEIMTGIADKMIETQKAVRRFDLLIKQLEDDRYWNEQGDEDFKKHVDKLIEYSDKGIFGERGGRDALMSWAQAKRAGSEAGEIQQEIMEWVGEQIAQSRQESDEKQSIEDKVIEKMVREAYRDQLEQAAAKMELKETSERQEADDDEALGQARDQLEGL